MNNTAETTTEQHEKPITIIVNAKPKQVTEKELSFDQLVRLAFNNPPTGDMVIFTITFRKGEGHKPDGTLIEGQTIKIKDGEIFNVTATNKS